MLLRHIRYLLAVAEQGSFTRAALTLHVSQPALSQQIRQLEDQMGTQLLDRSGRTVRPTDAGDAFLAYARRALAELEAGSRAVRDVRDLSSGTLRIACAPSFSAYLMAPLAQHFHDRHPGITLWLEEMAQEEIEAALGADRIDLGIATSDVHAEDVEWQPLHEERLGLIVGKQHPIAALGHAVGTTMLESLPLVLLSAQYATRMKIDSHFRHHGIRPTVAMEADSMETIIEIVRKGRLATILPNAVVHNRPSLRAAALAPVIETRQVALLQRRGGYRSAAARAFVALAEEEKHLFADGDRAPPDRRSA
ncbi:transcriptional regulator CynR [Sphingomonas sp. PR090111-T3T-6A]|uniref:transcriptional regulator CynR n=1 Tax=Sphingomonas sp. PR090111-T3T-6A TaxID=685778 RepID=UPI0003614DA8|nr:transcriptional regulator CynR [Sphingomonas sp. PR090111-T3T-6A]